MTENPIRIEMVDKPKTAYQRMREAVPLFISMLALLLSVYTGWETRLHNRLSLKPELHFFRTADVGAEQMGLFLENDGNGPGKVSQFAIFLDGKRIDGSDGSGGWDALAEAIPFPFSSQQLADGDVIRTNFRTALFAAKPSNVEDMDDFRKLIFNRLVVRIRYCSLYDDCEYICSTASDACDAKYL